MAKVLADHNVEGHLDVLASIWLADEWLELWQWLNGKVLTLAAIGVPDTILDSDLWLLCQQQEMLLITSNRNAHGEDSLEATMRPRCGPDSLSVLTIADSDRVMYDRQYAERVAVKVLEILLDLNRFRGTPRVYIP